jgi:hypothetical protein
MKVLEGGLVKVTSMQHQDIGNGDPVKVGGGLVTPPGPRSLALTRMVVGGVDEDNDDPPALEGRVGHARRTPPPQQLF